MYKAWAMTTFQIKHNQQKGEGANKGKTMAETGRQYTKKAGDGSHTDGSQTGHRRVTDGSQTGYRRVTDGSQTGHRRVTSAEERDSDINDKTSRRSNHLTRTPLTRARRRRRRTYYAQMEQEAI